MQPAAHGGPLRRLTPFLAPSRRDLALSLGAAITGQVLFGLAPVVQKVVIDDVIDVRRRSALPWLAALVVIALGGFALAFVRRWFGGRVAFSVQHELRTAVFERLIRLDFAGHDQLQTGQLVSRSSGDLGLVQSLLSTLPLLLGNLVLLAVSLVAMLLLSPALTLVTAVTLPVLALLSFRLRRTVFPATWHAQQRAAEVAGVVDEAVSGVRIVKGFGAEARETAKLAAAAERLFASRMRLVRVQSRATAALATVPALAQAGVLAFGGWLALQGRLSLGTFLAFASYLVSLVGPLRFSASIIASMEQARAGAGRLLDILDANAEVRDRPGARPLDELAGPIRGEVRFEGVRFGYERSHPVLDGFELTIAPGEVVALVGASGSGKSTVTALLPRFYDVAGGRVTIDGVDVRDATLASLRRHVGVAFEDAFLFSDTVRANIAYGRPDATDAEVRAAAAVAGATGFIEALPGGFDTVVGERGMTLSGGQRQRIALARAVVTDPQILVLDAATSAVDTATEEAIHTALAEVLAGRTTILVAHRSSTVRLADRVVVVEAGRVVDQGTHDELLARSARYRSLLGHDDVGGDVVDGAEPGSDDGWRPGTVSAAAWPVVAADAEPRARFEVPAGGRGGLGAGRGGGRGGGGGAGGAPALAATPALLAQLAALPPADDRSGVDPVAAAAEPAEPFCILRFVRPWRRRWAAGVALVAADAVLTVLGPVLIRHGIDEGVRAGSESVLFVTAGVFAAVTLADWAVTLAGALLTGRTAEAMLCSLRIRIFAHLQRLSLDYYDNEMDGRIMTRLTSDVEALSQLVQTGLVTAVVASATCLGVAVFLVVLSPVLALAAASVLPVLVAATVWYRRRSTVAYRDSREAIASVNANLQENLSGVRVAQANVGEGRSAARFAELSASYRSARLRAQKLLSLYFPGIGLLSDLAAVAVLAAGAELVGAGRTTTAVVIAFLLYLNLFFSPIQQLSQTFDAWQQATSSTVKITELLTTASATPNPPQPVVLEPLRGELAFDGVSYAYPGTDVQALRGVTLTIAAGETVALVGETGAGKSTIVRLVARFADPTAGTVQVDGVDLRRLDLEHYRQRLGMVPRSRSCSPGPCATTSPTAGPTPPTRRWRRRRVRWVYTASSPRCRTATARR
ncbi:MAG: ABC transporter ATP-binding protein [Acidimicrobiales bacterium]